MGVERDGSKKGVSGVFRCILWADLVLVWDFREMEYSYQERYGVYFLFLLTIPKIGTWNFHRMI
jgi:hypothetical protein